MPDPEQMTYEAAFHEAALPEVNAAQEEFVIDNEEKVAWFVGKIESAVRQIAILKEIHDRGSRRAAEAYHKVTMEREQRLKAEVSPYESEINSLRARFGEQVKTFIASRLNKRKRSEKHNGAQIGFKKQPDTVSIKDKEALINWLLTNDHDDLLEQEIKVKKKDLAAVLKEHGEVADGCELIVGQDKFYLTILGQTISFDAPDVTEQPLDQFSDEFAQDVGEF